MGFFDGNSLFDFDRDGKVDAFETFAGLQMFASSRQEAIDLTGDDTFYPGTDKLSDRDIGLSDRDIGLSDRDIGLSDIDDLDLDELENMDPDERRELLEEAGLDPDDYELEDALEDAGLSIDDLACMDVDERREALEDAGFDPDDYDDF